MPVARQLDGYFDTDSRHLDLVELRDLEFWCGTAGQYRKLVQPEFVLVIAAGDEAVHGNHVQNVPKRVAAISTRCGSAEAAREFSVLGPPFVQMEVRRR